MQCTNEWLKLETGWKSDLSSHGLEFQVAFWCEAFLVKRLWGSLVEVEVGWTDTLHTFWFSLWLWCFYLEVWGFLDCLCAANWVRSISVAVSMRKYKPVSEIPWCYTHLGTSLHFNDICLHTVCFLSLNALWKSSWIFYWLPLGLTGKPWPMPLGLDPAAFLPCTWLWPIAPKATLCAFLGMCTTAHSGW